MSGLILILAFAFRLAVPGWHYEFPRDHFSHPEFQTEWWYYTGNVKDAGGHRYGFELVFFRRGVEPRSANPSAWRLDDVYLAHFAVTDVDAGRFRYSSRVNRAGPGIAGVSEAEGRIWNGNWRVDWDVRNDAQHLTAIAEAMRIDLRLTPRTGPVIHGAGGLSVTGPLAGQASYYVSFPRLSVEGTLNGAAVTGLAWMDHEWFTSLLNADQKGWDWFSVQLDNGSELMLFDLRRADGAADPHSSGTFIPASGKPVNLAAGDFRLEAVETWKSPKSGAQYPVKWRIRVPRLGISLECAAAVKDQELYFGKGSGPSYWEGAVTYSGSAAGVGYLEMTGYSGGSALGSLR
ncbi:MAG TPA: lipocalin-like domain-containing protein [Candidatus Limnocylindrales bacterium]|nr:lipocalin-like domain-containing protein [Candidatus Limnocylindrales bacterium]